MHYLNKFALPLNMICSYLIIFTGIISAQSVSSWDEAPSIIKERKSFKRLEWFYRTRAYPYDTIPFTKFITQRDEQIQKANDASIEKAFNPWQNIGPYSITATWPAQFGNQSGRVRGLAVHPTNPAVAYIGPAAGGVWKTTNGGTTWSDLTSSFTTSAFGALAIDPVNPAIVYAGTGEAMSGWNTTTYSGDGIYKTTNDGASWSKISTGLGTYTQVAKIAVNPANASIVYAALAHGNWDLGYPSNEGIWRTTNGGTSWARVISAGAAFDITISPGNSAKVFAAVGGSTTGSGIYISSDFGATWTLSNSGLPTANTIARIQVSASGTSLYAVIFNSTSSTVAYKSTNDGVTWSQISAGVKLGGSYDGTTWNDQGWYDLMICANPKNPNSVFIGNLEIHRTTNGSAFSPMRNATGPYGGIGAWDSPMHVDYHTMSFAPSDTNIVYAGSDGGIYKSTDAGATWKSISNNLPTLQFYRVASHPTNQNILFGGAQDNGNFRTTSASAVPWTFVATGDGMECFYDYSNPTYTYFSSQQGGLTLSTNGGVSGSKSIAPTWDNTPAWTAPFFMHPTDHLTLYTASKSFWKSTNQGTSWTKIAANVTTDNIVSVSQSKVNPNYFILASGEFTYTPQVMVSTNGGVNWVSVAANIPGTARRYSRVFCDPVSATTMYAVRTGFGSGKIFKTTDLGTTWQNITSNLPDIPHNDIFVDPLSTAKLFVGNDFGIYFSSNSGGTWTWIKDGMPVVPVMAFSYFSYSGTRLLRAATHGRSVYQINLDQSATVTNTINLKADLSNITGTGANYFDPSTDSILVMGFNWDSLGVVTGGNRKMTKATGTNVYSTTLAVQKTTADTTRWKFKAYPDAKFTNAGLETGTDHTFRYQADGTTVDIPVTSPSIYMTTKITIIMVPESYVRDATTNAALPTEVFTIHMAKTTAPFVDVESHSAQINPSTLQATAAFSNLTSGSYYIYITHRNTIETWSKSGGEPITSGSAFSYNFTSAQTQAYGSNLVLKNGKWCFYSGDVDQNGFIDNSDLLLIDNDTFNFVGGSVASDVNGDKFVDNNDLIFCDNNCFIYVGKVTPR